MKRILLIIITLLICGLSYSQPCFEKCSGSALMASVTNDPTWTYDWTISPAMAFIGQGTNQIDAASIGSSLINYVITVEVTNAQGCISVQTACFDVIDNVTTLVLPDLCPNTSVAASGGSPTGGQYTYNGVVITTFDSSMSGLITYSTTVGACSGSDSGTLVIYPAPITTITIN